jgi:high-affinity iron transporter
MGYPALVVIAVLSTAQVPPVALESTQPEARAAASRVAATVQLAAQEYALAWEHGTLVKPSEANEARLFVAEARRAARSLPPSVAPRVDGELAALAGWLERSGPPDSVAASAARVVRSLPGGLRMTFADRPAREPSLGAGGQIYATRCAGCHGGAGHGDGSAAAGLTPPPADLTGRTAAVAPADYYRRVTYGVPGTAMPAFDSVLSRDERWDAIAYVLTFSDTLARRASSPSNVVAFAAVRGSLDRAMDLARRGEHAAAADQVFDAYLSFEEVEGPLRIVDAGLVSRAEARFGALRQAAGAGAGASLERRYATVSSTVDSAEAALGASPSGWGLVAESFLLVVREGFEAILIVGAIMAVVLRTGNRALRRGVRWGVALALAASLATAALLEWMLEGSTAKREALEGGVMLAAAVVLFYVSYWLISKVDADAWQRFVRHKIERAAASGSAVALASVAFLAVYREGFETVLFYKALYVTGGAAGTALITLGLAAGVVVLAGVYVGIEKFGIRIPLRPFFAVTGATLYFLAFVFAGTGVKELQEGAVVPATLVRGAPRSEFFGIYPTVESLALQGLIVACLIAAVVRALVARRRRRAVDGPAVEAARTP